MHLKRLFIDYHCRRCKLITRYRIIAMRIGFFEARCVYCNTVERIVPEVEDIG